MVSGRGSVAADRYKEILDDERQEREQGLETVVSDFRASLTDDVARKFDPKLEVIRGDPADVIPKKVQELNALFLIVGTVSRSGAAGLIIGNTVEEILQRVDCSVVTVKPQGFVSPVRPD